jgi:hypothetical protein
MPIIINQFKGQKAVIRVTGGSSAQTESYTLAGFSQTQNTTNGPGTFSSNDTITGFSVSKIIYAGNVQVLRGANTLFQSGTNNDGIWNLDTFGISLNEFPTANLTITTGTFGTAIVEVKKSFTANTVY